MATGKTVKEACDPKFSREQLMFSERFAEDADLLGALLKDGSYLVSEVEKKIQNYKKGKVK
ncbi:MAG: hypothetical protein HFG34_00350 [Eubacterium sp.]|nr:hypothetical protein [Eubacterium sp.]